MDHFYVVGAHSVDLCALDLQTHGHRLHNCVAGHVDRGQAEQVCLRYVAESLQFVLHPRRIEYVSVGGDARRRFV